MHVYKCVLFTALPECTVHNFLLRVLDLVIISLLVCAFEEDRVFSWSGLGNDSQVDTNENGDFKK